MQRVDTLLIDSHLSAAQKTSINNLCNWKFSGIQPGVLVQSVNLFLSDEKGRSVSPLLMEKSLDADKTFQHVCVGGTFDR